MNFEEANLREAKMLLLWWSKGALLWPPGTLSDVLSVLAGNKNRKKMDTFVRACINRRRILENGEPIR